MDGQPRGLALLVAAVVAVQVGVPALMLLGGEQNRFGWQMYAGRTSLTTLEPLDSRGETVEILAWAAALRPEVSWVDVAPAALCARDDRVVEVRFSYSDGTVRRVPCP